MYLRIIIFFIFTGIFCVVFALGTTAEPTPEEVAQIMDYFEEILLKVDSTLIFTHNLTIALPMFIPGFGAFWGLFSAWSTGFAFAAIQVATPELADVNPLALLLTPFGLMELTAYSIAMSRSFLLAKTLLQRKSIFAQKTIILAEIGIVTALLVIGGIVEMYMIDAAEKFQSIV
ncbi:stage II sporulation protein M [Candidatus Nitrosopelagicus sp.]|nr:stage II sporulation protein M [Candidatus Nitrosopelagicus sp.]